MCIYHCVWIISICFSLGSWRSSSCRQTTVNDWHGCSSLAKDNTVLQPLSPRPLLVLLPVCVCTAAHACAWLVCAMAWVLQGTTASGGCTLRAGHRTHSAELTVPAASLQQELGPCQGGAERGPSHGRGERGDTAPGDPSSAPSPDKWVRQHMVTATPAYSLLCFPPARIDLLWIP